MITEDYVSFEVAKLLKEKGFYQDFLSEITPVWKLNGNRTELAFYGCDNYPCETDEWYSAPTLQMAMKWLREVHHVYMYAAHDGMLDKWFARVYGDVKHIKDVDWHKSYEEACEEAIKYCLENLT